MAQYTRISDERPAAYRKIAFVQLQQVGAHTRAQYARFDDEPKLDDLTDVSSDISSSDEGSFESTAARPVPAKAQAPCDRSRTPIHSSLRGRTRSWCNRGISLVAILAFTVLLAQLVGIVSIGSPRIQPDESFHAVVQGILRPEQYEAVSQAATLAHDLSWNEGNQVSKTLSDMIKKSALVLENWDGRLRRSNTPELRNVGLPDLLDLIWSIHGSSKEMDSLVQEELYSSAVNNAALKLHDELNHLRKYTTRLQAALGPRTRLNSFKNSFTALLSPSRTCTVFKDWQQTFIFFARDREALSRKIIQQTEKVLAINNLMIQRYGDEYYPLLEVVAKNFRQKCLALEKEKGKACGPEVQLSKDFDLYNEEKKREEVTLAFVQMIMDIQDAHREFADGLARSIVQLEAVDADSRLVSLNALSAVVETVLEYIEAALLDLQPFLERYADIHG